MKAMREARLRWLSLCQIEICKVCFLKVEEKVMCVDPMVMTRLGPRALVMSLGVSLASSLY